MLVLLLNSSYEPLRITTWQRAFCLFYSGKADIIEQYDSNIRSVSFSIRCPSVVRMKYYIKTIRKSIKPSRSLVLQRDNYICQYCGKKLNIKSATIDHIIPKCRGGSYSWENLVCSCYDCNNKKRNRLPIESNMTLLKNPVKVTWKNIMSFCLNNKEINNTWNKYIK